MMWAQRHRPALAISLCLLLFNLARSANLLKGLYILPSVISFYFLYLYSVLMQKAGIEFNAISVGAILSDYQRIRVEHV